MKIDELNLSTRTYNVLLRAGVTTTEKIKKMTDDDLRNIKNMSEKCLMEVRCAVYCAEDLMACQGMSRHICMDIELLVAGTGMENIAVSDPKEEQEK